MGGDGGRLPEKTRPETHEIYQFIYFICEKNRTILNVFFSRIWSRVDFFTDIFWMGQMRLDIQTFFCSFVADMMEYKGMFWDVYVSI